MHELETVPAHSFPVKSGRDRLIIQGDTSIWSRSGFLGFHGLSCPRPSEIIFRTGARPFLS